MTVTADQIIARLRAKHREDVFVAECKDGPTQGTGGHLRMDAWVMPRSWAKPWCTGYEVKVSRADFLQDDKWPLYLPLCHRFYFVCPSGLIDPAELSEGTGLLWASKTGSRLWTKRKAALREDIEIPETLWRYVLMCRARIMASEYESRRPTVDEWRAWVEGKKDAEWVGTKVSAKVRGQVAQAECDVRLMRAQVRGYQRVRELLEGLGMNPDAPISEWQVDTVRGKLLGLIDTKLPDALRDVSRDAAHLAGRLDAAMRGERG